MSIPGCALGQRSGIVTAQRGKLKRLFCLRSGHLVFAASNLIEEQFDEVLLRAELVTVGSLTAAREKNGLEEFSLCGDALAKYTTAEIERWGQVTRKAGIEKQ